MGEVLPGQDKVFETTLQALQSGDEIVFVDLIQNGLVVDSMLVLVQVRQETSSQNNPPSVVPPFGYLLAGGVSLLCLLGLVAGGFMFYTRRKPRVQSRQSPKSRVSSSQSATQIKQALEFARAKQYEEASNILKQVVQSEPNNLQAWFNLGIALGYMENFSDAERCLLRAKQLGHPKADDSLIWLREKRK
jgi:cytochrome c-type biogenesis protein CcmH/NrfG